MPFDLPRRQALVAKGYVMERSEVPAELWGRDTRRHATDQTNRRVKQADLIVEEIKRWITSDKQPGDRLPQERDLIAHFGSSRSSVREALRTLEVQGLVRIRTGPNGGAFIAEIPPERTYEVLRNYLHFEGLNGIQIYQLRKLLEPELAASTAEALTEADFAALADTLSASSGPWTDIERIQEMRVAEIEFHNILARACPNPLLRVWCLFLNDLLEDLVVYRKGHVATHDEYIHSNTDYHTRLLEALHRRDRYAVREIMLAHMIDCENYMMKLEGVVEQKFLSPKLRSLDPREGRQTASR